jgi:serine/threonine protein kinase
MPGIPAFLRRIGSVVAQRGGRALAGLVPLGELLYDVAHDSWEDYRRKRSERPPLPEPISPTGPAEAAEQPRIVPGPRGNWKLGPLLAVGDVADVHLARIDGDPRPVAAASRAAAGVGLGSADLPARIDGDSRPGEPDRVLKIARVPEGVRFLDNEREILTRLASRAGDTTYRRYLPALIESFSPTGSGHNRVHVFEFDPGFYTLEQVHEQHPVLDGRHLAWIFNRLLTVLGFCHRAGIVHGAVLPGHVLIHAAEHGLRLIGWGQGVRLGGRLGVLCARYRDWYPPEVLHHRPVAAATDLFLAARCLVYLAGGDVAGNRMPATVPAALQSFIHGCLLDGVRMRPQDAWELQDEFSALLCRLYGSPEFHPLTMTPRNSHG